MAGIPKGLLLAPAVFDGDEAQTLRDSCPRARSWIGESLSPARDSAWQESLRVCCWRLGRDDDSESQGFTEIDHAKIRKIPLSCHIRFTLPLLCALCAFAVKCTFLEAPSLRRRPLLGR